MAKEKPIESIPAKMGKLMEESVIFEDQEMPGSEALTRLLRKVMLSTREPTNLRLQAVKMILELNQEKKTDKWD